MTLDRELRKSLDRSATNIRTQTLTINGQTVLESNGKVAASALPDLAITNTFVVADQNERLSLDAEEGDVAIQQDVDESYILTTSDPTVDSNWSELVTSPAQHAATHEKGGSDELTVFGNTTHDSISTGSLTNGGSPVNIDDPISANDCLIHQQDFTFPGSTGWTTLVTLSHNGGGGGVVRAKMESNFEDSGGGISVNEEGTLALANLDSNFGTAGSTTAISSNQRFKVDDSDNTTAYLQINLQSQYDTGYFFVRLAGREFTSQTALIS